MSSVNRVQRSVTNSAGTEVKPISKQAMLVRLTLAHMLFEDTFYVDGQSSTMELANLIKEVDSEFVSDLAIKARTKYNLRHVPLFLCRELARLGKLKADTLFQVIQRPDELGEFLALYWKDGKTPISNQVKKGLASAFGKFNEYQLAKWNKNSAVVKLRDVLFLCHPKPTSPVQEELYRKVASNTLVTPDTWEVELSSGADKAETFVRLMKEKKLGALAFLRNLRNMTNSGVPESLIRSYAATLDVSRVLPFRYLSAAKYAPSLKDMLETMMFRSLSSMPKLTGRTILVVDTSGSMGSLVSAKSELSRKDAAVALAILARELCEEVVIYATAGNDWDRKHATGKVPNTRGFALEKSITSCSSALGGGGIFFSQAINYIAKQEQGNSIDRVIVFTDEQDTSVRGRDYNPSLVPRLAPAGKNYIANVGSNKNGLNNSEWTTITGFSESLLEFIQISENT